ncbi:MAG: hypothetical protein ABI588_10120, partial [Arenimonas sp.]
MKRALSWLFTAALALALLFLIFDVYAAGQPIWALGLLVLSTLGFVVYLHRGGFAWRYLFPGVAGMVLFVAFPLLYTAQIGFTNYSSNNLLSLDRARDYLLEQGAADEGKTLAYSLHAEGSEFRLVLQPLHEAEELADPVRAAQIEAASLVSPPLALRSAQPPEETQMLPLAQASFHLNAPLSLKALLAHRDVLMRLQLRLPDGRVMRYAGVREFGPVSPLWKANADGSVTLVESGEIYRPDMATGFFTGEKNGAQLQPGFKVNIGFGNYRR